MAKVVYYTLKEHPRTGEYHLFESTRKDDDSCSTSEKSMCKAMD